MALGEIACKHLTNCFLSGYILNVQTDTFYLLLEKKMKKQLLVLCVICVLSLGLLGFAGRSAQAAEKYIVAGDCYWPPMEFLGEDKTPIGYTFDLLAEMARLGGFEIEVRNVAWDGIFGGVAMNKYDIVGSSCTITEERQKQFDFSDPYYEVTQAVILPAGKSIASLADLKGKKVGGQVATTGIFVVRDANVGAELKEFDDVGLAIEALVTGRLDAVVCDDPVAMYYVNMRKDYAGKLNISYKHESKQYFGFVVKKGRKDLVDKLNASLKMAREAGIDKKLAQKWFGGN